MNLVKEGLALGIPAPAPEARQRPSPSRIYRMWFSAGDAALADQDLTRNILNAFPWEPAAAKANRAHHLLVTKALAARGISQFLDLGCGSALPRPQGGGDLLFAQNTHDVAQQHWCSARVVYADIDHAMIAWAPTASRHTADLTDMARLEARRTPHPRAARRRPPARRPTLDPRHRPYPVRPSLAAVGQRPVHHPRNPRPGPDPARRVKDVHEGGIAFRLRSGQWANSLFGDWDDLDGGPLRILPTARHQTRHQFSAVPDQVCAAYAAVIPLPA
ncbi:SAM-dependent methyltransferase [Streptomyces vinaceus]